MYACMPLFVYIALIFSRVLNAKVDIFSHFALCEIYILKLLKL